MSDTSSERSPQYFVDSLQQYVLAPLSAATHLVNQERKEVNVEQEAFEKFRERLEGIDPAPTPPDRAIRITGRTSTTNRVNRVRTAYRETVLSIPHYDDAYGESLVEHFANEFGAAVAVNIRPESSVSFTLPYKNTLEARATQAIRKREEFVRILETEIQSLESARADLLEVSAALDTTIIPEWHHESFTEQLDTVAERRQQTIQERGSLPKIDHHSLCAYLYEDKPWTYPVLTAVARTREVVSLEYSTNPETTSSARG